MDAFVFPGQGSQFQGMGKDLADQHPEAANLFAQANEILGFSLTDIMFAGSADDLRQTRVTQPAIFVHSMAIRTVLGNDFSPQMVAGHSLGEFSALVASESIDLVNALKLVHKRGIFMENCVNGSMYAILNANFDDISRICNEVENRLGQIVSPANINAPNQVVIAGEVESVESVVKNLNDMGVKRCIKLKVSAPSHCKF